MVARTISLPLGKRLWSGFALSGILLSAGIFGLVTAETKESKGSNPVRILLTDDTPDDTLSVRRTSADQRDLDKLYNNELRPIKPEPKQEPEPVVEAEAKSASKAEIVPPKTLISKIETPATKEQVKELPQPKSKKNDLDSISTALTLPKFDVFGTIESTFNAIEDELLSATESSDDNRSTNNHQFKFKRTYSNRDSVDHASTDFSDAISIDTVLPTIDLSKFNVFGTIESTFNAIEDELLRATESSDDNRSTNNHKLKFKRTYSTRDSVDHASTGFPAVISIDTVLPTIDLSKFDVFGDMESTLARIGNEFASVATSAVSQNTFEYDSKLKHPGDFTPRHEYKTNGAEVHLPTIGSLDGIQFPKTKLSDIESIFGANTAQLIDENGKVPANVQEKIEEQTSKPMLDGVEDEQSARPVKERRSIMALLGLDGLGIPEFNNPFEVGTGVKETGQNVEPVETENINPDLDESNLEPDESVTSELPSLSTERPAVPGVEQIPTLAPVEIPVAPNPIDEQDKSASRVSPYRALVNPDRFLPQHSVVPVSVRISDSLNR
jgi:hypothetical protein